MRKMVQMWHVIPRWARLPIANRLALKFRNIFFFCHFSPIFKIQKMQKKIEKNKFF